MNKYINEYRSLSLLTMTPIITIFTNLLIPK
jgi:hypothetical protein